MVFTNPAGQNIHQMINTANHQPLASRIHCKVFAILRTLKSGTKGYKILALAPVPHRFVEGKWYQGTGVLKSIGFFVEHAHGNIHAILQNRFVFRFTQTVNQLLIDKRKNIVGFIQHILIYGLVDKADSDNAHECARNTMAGTVGKGKENLNYPVVAFQ